MEETCEVAMIHGRKDHLRDGGGWTSAAVSPSAVATTSNGSSSLFSSTSGLTDDEDDDDGVTSSSRPPGPRGGVSSSSLSSLTSSESSSSDTMQTDGAGPLYELSTMLDHLPTLRTGLSRYYQGRSQSFTSLADVSCVEDLAKKTTPYIRRTKASRGYAAALGAKNRLSKTIAKKAPRGSPVRPIAKGRNTSGKPPAYQGKREVYRC